MNGGNPVDPRHWDPVAAASGLSTREQIDAWKEIGIVALAYRHLLQRQPTPEETRRHITELKAGTSWKELWRRLAHSAEREQRFGYWAPAPISPADDPRQIFDLPLEPRTEQCFGGLGHGCDGGVPEIFENVQPRWQNGFTMPDGTRMGYVETGVAVGSILHDNACLRDHAGLNCSGYLAVGEAIKSALIPGALEWNKASWNVVDQRNWRARFGPYPVDDQVRKAEWYDDLRLAENRPAKMAHVLGLQVSAVLSEPYSLGETRGTRALKAPAGTSLDHTDAAFCASGTASGGRKAPGKAPWVICR